MALWYRRVVTVQVADPRAHAADRELRLSTPAQHQKRIVLPLSSLGKDQNPKIQGRFLLNAYCFCTIVKSKKGYIQTIVSWAPSVFYFNTIHTGHSYMVEYSMYEGDK